MSDAEYANKARSQSVSPSSKSTAPLPKQPDTLGARVVHVVSNKNGVAHVQLTSNHKLSVGMTGIAIGYDVKVEVTGASNGRYTATITGPALEKRSPTFYMIVLNPNQSLREGNEKNIKEGSSNR